MSCDSEEDTNPKTILDIFHETSVKYSNEPALYYKKDSFGAITETYYKYVYIIF